ncbi:MAG: leucine-rich repeat domain-containing protein [Prevotella sp.]|nr:leucine-rich repeat domain-containing protein [Prevotella sp.]
MKKGKKSILGRLMSEDESNRKFEHLVINLVLQKVSSDRFCFDGKAVYTADKTLLIYQLADEAKAAVPEGVQRIGRQAFVHHDRLTRLTLPKSLCKIGREAFCCCGKLEAVTVPATVKCVNGLAFAHCGALKEVVFEGIPEHISPKAFGGCTSLRTVRVPEGSAEAFGKCLRSVVEQGAEIVEQKKAEPLKPQPKPEPKKPAVPAAKPEQPADK